MNNHDSLVQMWRSRVPRMGDHIRISRGLYNHHGIYINDDEIIHFSGEHADDILGRQNTVCKTTLNGFLQDGKLEIRIYDESELSDLYLIIWVRLDIDKM